MLVLILGTLALIVAKHVLLVPVVLAEVLLLIVLGLVEDTALWGLVSFRLLLGTVIVACLLGPCADLHSDKAFL